MFFLSVLEVIKDHDDSWPFLEAVKVEEAPHYYEYIKVCCILITLQNDVFTKFDVYYFPKLTGTKKINANSTLFFYL